MFFNIGGRQSRRAKRSLWRQTGSLEKALPVQVMFVLYTWKFIGLEVGAVSLLIAYWALRSVCGDLLVVSRVASYTSGGESEN